MLSNTILNGPGMSQFSQAHTVRTMFYHKTYRVTTHTSLLTQSLQRGLVISASLNATMHRHPHVSREGDFQGACLLDLFFICRRNAQFDP